MAALGTLFFEWVTSGGFVDDAPPVLVVGAVLYAVTLALVWLLPRHAQDEYA